MHVVSILDINYVLNPTSSYHPAFIKGAKSRLQTWTGVNPVYKAALDHAFHRAAAQTAWAILFELDNQPLLVLRNLACQRTSLTFRRILRVKLGTILSNPNSVTINDISDPIQNNLMTEESGPLP